MDLSEICKEYREQAGEGEKDEVLPQRVGGSKVHLLLGIKNTNLDPVFVKVLPSGIAMYMSLFKDILGSRLVFAGPHISFTKADNGIKSEMLNAVFLIREKILEEFQAGTEERYYSIRTNEKLGLSVNHHLINGGDFLGCNGEILNKFEESLNDHEKQ